MKTLLALAAAFSMAVSTGAVMADSGSYTGNWQVKLTHDVYVTNTGYNGHGPNTTHCIALTDDGSVGWTHSGYAVLDNNINTSGQFVVIGPTILVYITGPGSDESIASYVFSATASNGKIAEHGAFDYIEGGESYDADKAAFGANGSC
jgi:hypothetical protein